MIIGIDWKSGCRLYATMASARRLKIGNMEKNVNFVPSIDGYARMRIFFLAQVSGSCFVSAFPDFVFVRPAPTTLFSILFLLRLNEVGDFTFLQNSWQSIYNFKIIFVQNFSPTSVFVGILNSIQDYFWNLLIFIFMNCFFNTFYSANFMIVLV